MTAGWRGRVGLAAAAMAALATSGGCASRHVAWTDRSPVVQPRPSGASPADAPLGYLVLAMPANAALLTDGQMPRYPPGYVYDKSGRYIEDLPNNTEHPTPLQPGEYIVLVGKTDPLGKFHQVQVRIDQGRTTVVGLSDVAEAPRFWELSRRWSRWWRNDP